MLYFMFCCTYYAFIYLSVGISVSLVWAYIERENCKKLEECELKEDLLEAVIFWPFTIVMEIIPSLIKNRLDDFVKFVSKIVVGKE